MAVEKDQLKRIIEGAIFAADKALTIDQLAQLFFEEDIASKDVIREAVVELQAEYDHRGVELKEVSSGFRFQVRKDVGEWVSRLWDEKPARYSRALLETLALVAYRQPITRGEIEEIRGVSVSSYIVKSLLEREWVRVVGHRDVPGRPAMYATTRDFLDYFNLSNLDELPSLAEIRDFDKINEELELIEQGGDLLSLAGKASTEESKGVDVSKEVNDETSNEDKDVVDVNEENENNKEDEIVNESEEIESEEIDSSKVRELDDMVVVDETAIVDEATNVKVESEDTDGNIDYLEEENYAENNNEEISGSGITFKQLTDKLPDLEVPDINADEESEEAEVSTDV